MKNIFSKVSSVKITRRVLFALILLLPFSARAGVKEGSLEISPFLGYNFFESGQNLNDNLLYGGRISYNFSKVFGLEGTLEWVNTNVRDRTITGDKQGQFRYPIDKVNMYFYNLDAVFNLMPDSDFTFFVLGGFGAVDYSPSIESGDMSTFDLGVGAKYWLSDNLGLRLDVRDNMVTEIFYENAFLKEYYQNLNVTLGLVLALGGETGKKEAVKEAAPIATPVATPEVLYVAEEPKIEEKVASIAAQPEEKTVVLAFEDVHFNYGESALSDSAKAIIKRTVRILKDNPKAHIRIAGYTSKAGTEEYNQGLSERRANEVEYYLIKSGIVSNGRVSTIGYGETKPAISEVAPQNHYSKAAKANMRVLFEVVVK